MWAAINPTSQNSNRASNLKQLKLTPLKSNQSSPDTDQTSIFNNTTPPPATWRKELRLTTVAERQRKKLSTATTSSSSTCTNYSHSSSRVLLTPFDLPRIDHRLSDLDEKLEVMENMISARQQFFEVLSKDSNILNDDLQKQLVEKNSQSFSPARSDTFNTLQVTKDEPLDPAQPNNTLHQDSSSSNQSVEPLADSSDSALGWGEYFTKKFW